MSSNLEVVRERIGAGRAILLVVKADAYGHGAVPVALHALRNGVSAVGVTCAAEARELRRAGIRARTVVLGPVLEDEAPDLAREDVELCLPSAELLGRVDAALSSVERPARVHLKIDTGMGRLGVAPEEALGLLARIQASPRLELAGVMTHVAAPEGALAESAHLQLAVFERVLATARDRGLLCGRSVWVHAANSGAVLSGLLPARARHDAVRIGIAAYGIAPHPGLDTCDLRPVLSVRTRVVHLRELARGAPVGYGATWTAKRPSRIAILPIGYADGVDCRLSNRGAVLVGGRRAPIVGRVSMDYTSVDVTDVPGVELGERATLLGKDGAEQLRVEEVADLIGTIPYEIVCSLGKRVTRTYLGGRVAKSPSLVG